MDRCIDIRQLQGIFDRRARHFDKAAFLTRQVAQRMHERLAYIKLTPARVLDTGCGPGADLAALQSRFTDATVVGLDVSHQMISRAAALTPPVSASWRNLFRREKSWRHWLDGLCAALIAKRSRSNPCAVQADFSALPFASSTFELLWSNLVLHWQTAFGHPAFDPLFLEWHRVLKTGGLLMFSTLGPDSLRELRAAWRVADRSASHAHVIDFADMHDLGDALVNSGFESPVVDREVLTINYRSPQALLDDVRCWGAYPSPSPSHAREDRPTGLTGRGVYTALIAALDAQRCSDHTLPLTIEIIYGHAWKGAIKKTPKGYGIVRVDEIKRRLSA